MSAAGVRPGLAKGASNPNIHRVMGEGGGG
jgi:hypothetical protein